MALSPTNLGDSLMPTTVILSISGNVLVNVIGSFIKLLTEKLRSINLSHLFHRNYLGTLARKEKAKILSINGR